MKSTFLRTPNEMEWRGIAGLIGIEVLIFFLPTSGKIEGRATSYWDGVRLRFLSGNFWVRAFLCGIGAALILKALLVLSGHLTRFAEPPSGSNQP
jgi:hypothetical protein